MMSRTTILHGTLLLGIIALAAALPNATTPDCTAVTDKGGSAESRITRLVTHTVKARSKAASRISASPGLKLSAASRARSQRPRCRNTSALIRWTTHARH